MLNAPRRPSHGSAPNLARRKLLAIHGIGRELSPMTSGPMRTGPRHLLDYARPYRRSFLVGLLFLVLTQGFQLLVPQLLRVATDALIKGSSGEVVQAALGMIAVALLGTAFRIGSRLKLFGAGRHIEYDLRNDLFFHLEHLGHGFYSEMPTGQVLSRVINDLSSVRLVLGPALLNLTNTALVYAVVLPLLFWQDAELAFYALLPLPFLIVLGVFFSRLAYRFGKEAQDRLGGVSAKLQENLTGAMTIRAYRKEAEEAARFDRLNLAYMNSNLALARLRGALMPTMALGGTLTTLIALQVGGARVMAGEMTVGAFVQFTAYLASLTWPTVALGWSVSLTQLGRAAFSRVNDIFQTAPELSMRTEAPLPPDNGQGFELRSLSFHYPKTEKPILHEISLQLKPGGFWVIVGPTGSGKSHLLEALARAIPVRDGCLFWGGVDVNQRPLWEMRKRIAYAPQEAFLFSRSLRENLRFGKPEASDAELLHALQLAAFDGDFARLPDGLDTLIGERGLTLSGGQRQRISLARALITQPDILILDDSFSQIDTETEQRIVRQLKADKPETTLILATHRLLSASRADRVFVLDEGRLVESGSESELLAQKGLYQRMHHEQQLRMRLEEV